MKSRRLLSRSGQPDGHHTAAVDYWHHSSARHNSSDVAAFRIRSGAEPIETSLVTMVVLC